MWFYCGIIIAVAIAGKFGGATFSARLSGMSWREAGAVGVLMNTRGLMELVVLNIRTRYRSHLAGAFYHDGLDGAGDHLHDNAFAETDVPDTGTSGRSSPLLRRQGQHEGSIENRFWKIAYG